MSTRAWMTHTAGEAPVFPLSAEQCDRVARAALEEDHAFDDVTTVAVVPPGARATAR